ncbi:hypothetical protein [Shigella phage ESh36]|nr:hypothetical protein [Shigella phage ESh30]URY16186.1 hypothetical protein [Shigella phage ESh36]
MQTCLTSSFKDKSWNLLHNYLTALRRRLLT